MGDPLSYRTGFVPKLDNQAVDGLTGIEDSLAYKVAEIEGHLHGWERWYGLALVPNAEVHVADRIGTAVAALQIDAGNLAWGVWVCILGSSDTPADVGMVKFDPHRLMITAAERQVSYFIQLGFGASGVAALAAGTYTEFVYKPTSLNAEETPLEIQVRRSLAGTKVFARCYVPTQNTGTLDFFLGLHEYAG
jgi:hypothetical protein